MSDTDVKANEFFGEVAYVTQEMWDASQSALRAALPHIEEQVPTFSTAGTMISLRDKMRAALVVNADTVQNIAPNATSMSEIAKKLLDCHRLDYPVPHSLALEAATEVERLGAALGEANLSWYKLLRETAGLRHPPRVETLEAEVSTLREHLAEVNRLMSLNCTHFERVKAAAALAIRELETFEHEMSGIAPEAVSKARPMLVAALANRGESAPSLLCRHGNDWLACPKCDDEAGVCEHTTWASLAHRPGIEVCLDCNKHREIG